MNRSYRIVWSKARGMWMVACETAKSQGKDGGTLERAERRSNGEASSPWRAALRKLNQISPTVQSLALALALAFSAPTLLWAGPPTPTQLPTGAQIAAGQANVQVNGSQMTVNQSSDKAVLNWQSFDIGASAGVRFNQPGRNSVALNRVQSSEASQIFGQLTANGQIVLVNPSGVVFGPNSRVDVGGLVAAAMKITDEDFLAGRYKFTDGQGVITNQGMLSAQDAGYIALLAPEVRNEGIIRAKQGTVVLAAGEAITLKNLASGMTVAVDKGSYKALIDNKQLVSAEDGTVFMSARAASALQQAVINNSGRIEAQGAVRVGGKIRLSANVVNNSGSIDASAAPSAPGGEKSKGGDIQIAASEFVNTGTIRANGDQGGSITVATAHSLRNEGVIEAKGGSGAGGQVTLISGGSLTQTAGASVSVRSEGAGASGGDIRLRAAQLNLSGTLDGSSDGQGGSIRLVANQSNLDGAQVSAEGDSAGDISNCALRRPMSRCQWSSTVPTLKPRPTNPGPCPRPHKRLARPS